MCLRPRRDRAGHLVGRGGHGQLAVLLHHQPGPAAAEARGRSRVELILECVKRAKVLVDGRLQVGGGPVGLCGAGHHLPEQRVVVVAAAVVPAEAY